MVLLEAGGKGVLVVVVTVRTILGGGEEKGFSGSSIFGQRRVDKRRVGNAHGMPMDQYLGQRDEVAI